MSGFQTPMFRGITKLSELLIDADKDWAVKGITNLKELALAMARGDLVVRGGTVLIKLPPSTIGRVLTSAGPLHIPSWQPAGGGLRYYYPVCIDLDHNEALVNVEASHNKNISVGTHYDDQLETDDVAGFKLLKPSIALVDSEAIITPDATYNKNSAIATAHTQTVAEAVGGAVADDGGVQTDETTAANNATENDMHLLPAVVAQNDAYYIGSAHTFGYALFYIGTAGVGTWDLQWEYYNGTVWVALSGVTDDTNNFKNSGHKQVLFTVPGDWAVTTVGGIANLYWIRGRVTTTTPSTTTQSLGNQAWVKITA